MLKRLFRWIGCAALLAPLITGCGAARAEAPVVTAGDFTDVFSADLAGDARSLFWVVAGQLTAHAKRLDVRLYQRLGDGDWTSAPRLTRALDPGAHPSLVLLAGAPCVGYQADRPVIGCLRGGRWRMLTNAGLPARPAELATLVSVHGALVAAFVSGVGPGSRVTVLRLEGGRWHVLGRPLRTHGAIATLGQPAAGSEAIDVALTDVPRRRRWLLTFDGRAWRRSAALEGVGGGPMPGGPVRAGGRVFLPVVDADATPWAFSVYVLEGVRWTRLGPLNRGPGNAQGVVSAAGGAVWATWQQNALRPDGRFATRVYAQRIAPAAAARPVWRGVTIGPGSVDTVLGANEPTVLYMPASGDGKGLTARVEPLG